MDRVEVNKLLCYAFHSNLDRYVWLMYRRAGDVLVYVIEGHGMDFDISSSGQSLYRSGTYISQLFSSSSLCSYTNMIFNAGVVGTQVNRKLKRIKNRWMCLNACGIHISSVCYYASCRSVVRHIVEYGIKHIPNICWPILPQMKTEYFHKQADRK